MRTFLIAFAIAGTAAAPAAAQPTATPNQAPAKAKYVEKVVCEKVQEERSTGSRLGSTTKLCKKVKVLVEEAENKADGTTHAH